MLKHGRGVKEADPARGYGWIKLAALKGDALANKNLQDPLFTPEVRTVGAKQRPVMLVASHLLDPVPIEIHVFWNLWSGIPLDIMTPPYGTVWGISKGHISLVQRRGPK
jgi:hypothetical protein